MTFRSKDYWYIIGILDHAIRMILRILLIGRYLPQYHRYFGQFEQNTRVVAKKDVATYNDVQIYTQYMQQ